MLTLKITNKKHQYPSKVYVANVKVFADKQMDGRTNRRAKNYMPPIYRCGGIKKSPVKSTESAKMQMYWPISACTLHAQDHDRECHGDYIHTQTHTQTKKVLKKNTFIKEEQENTTQTSPTSTFILF